MKFNWGTGILIFIILFLLAAGVFIGFAMRQDVNLVHQDYYERGVDHTSQMEKEIRSATFQDAVETRFENGSLFVIVDEDLAATMDSARVELYRPSDSKLDLESSFDPSLNVLEIPGQQLVPGRYILRVHWSASGLKYEIEKTVVIR